MRIATRAVRRLSHVLVGGFLCISCGEPERRDAAVRLTQDASTVAPLSGISSIALVNETTACVIDSYEVGSTLAVLADRPVASDDADGIPAREIDWYDVRHLEVELARMREGP